MSTITTINSGDAISDSRAVINTNFSNLNTDKYEVGGTDVAVADGGTGASTAAGARTNLGLGTLATQNGTFSGTSSGTNTGDQTNITGNAATVTTNANLTGPITSVGNATSIASQTGTGTKFVVDTSPTLVTPTLGVATATSINKVAFTAPATSATIVATDGTTTTLSGGTHSGTNTGDQTLPTDATITTTDVTTNNASTSKHGWFPKLPTATGLYLKDDLTWGTPAGSGDMVLASVQSVTGLKTFDKDKIATKGTSTGVTTISTANTSATSYTQTLPARDGTIANLDNVTYIGTTSVALNRTSAALTLAGITLTTPDIGTPSAGTLTNCTGLPLSGVVGSTSEALGVGSLELGHASDTTLTRVSAGVVAVEGVNVLTTAGGTLTGNITLGEGADPATIGIVMDASMSADERYSGITVPGTAGATLAFGDLCYLDVTATEWLLADADAAATSGSVVLGICVDASTDGNPTSMLLLGTVRSAAFPASIALGAPVYVDTTAGDITATQPSGTDDVIRVVGWAVTAEPNTIYFNPSSDYITHT